MKKVVNNICNLFITKHGIFFAFSIFFITIILLYGKAINYDISGFDDESFSKISFKQHSIKDIFTKDVFLSNDNSSSSRPIFYRPVLILSFAVDSLLNQSAQTFHTTNILLHFICSIIFFIFLRKYFFNYIISFLATLLFILHPANVFTVAWIPGRNDSLLFILFFSSVIFFFEYLDKDKIIFLICHFFSLFLALLTKETGLFIPFICSYYLLTKKSKKSFPIIFLYCLSIISFITIYHKVTPSILAFNANDYLTNFIYGIKFILDYYSALYFYNIHFSSYIRNTYIILGISAIILSFIFSMFSKLKKEEKIICFFMPILFLSFSLILKPIFFQGNRLYIPIAFIIITFMSFITNFKNKKLLCLIFLFLFSCSAYISSNKIKFFQNPLIFFEAIDKEKENYNVEFISNLYSYNLLKFGEYKKASKKAKEVAEITNYKNSFNLYILSITYIYEKDYEKAIDYLEKIVNFDKKNICSKLYLCYEKLGNLEKSLYYYKELFYILGNETDVKTLLKKERDMLND